MQYTYCAHATQPQVNNSQCLLVTTADQLTQNDNNQNINSASNATFGAYLQHNLHRDTVKSVEIIYMCICVCLKFLTLS